MLERRSEICNRAGGGWGADRAGEFAGDRRAAAKVRQDVGIARGPGLTRELDGIGQIADVELDLSAQGRGCRRLYIDPPLRMSRYLCRIADLVRV